MQRETPLQHTPNSTAETPAPASNVTASASSGQPVVRYEPRPIMTKSEAAEYLRISIRHIQRLVNARQIRPARINRRVLFTRQELDRYVELKMAMSA